MLQVIGKALENVQNTRQQGAKHKAQCEIDQAEAEERHLRINAMIRAGQWHDGRIDCVAGNGVMSELGYGDEPMLDKDAEFVAKSDAVAKAEGEKTALTAELTDRQLVNSIPVVIIKSFASRNAAIKEELLAALANWAADLAKNKVNPLH
jgi:hypothetical protein